MRILQERNRHHFGQPKECALTSPPLDFTMKFMATCPTADAILNGTYLVDTSTPLPQLDEPDADTGSKTPSTTDTTTTSNTTASPALTHY